MAVQFGNVCVQQEMPMEKEEEEARLHKGSSPAESSDQGGEIQVQDTPLVFRTL